MIRHGYYLILVGVITAFILLVLGIIWIAIPTTEPTIVHNISEHIAVSKINNFSYSFTPPDKFQNFTKWFLNFSTKIY